MLGRDEVMPEVGEVRKAGELFPDKVALKGHFNPDTLYKYTSCPGCGTGHWLRKRDKVPKVICAVCKKLKLGRYQPAVRVFTAPPVVGEIRTAMEVYPERVAKWKGYWSVSFNTPFMYRHCDRCGRDSWKNMTDKRVGKGCKHCKTLKSGRTSDRHGYISILLSPTSLYYPMTKSKASGGRYVLEHRLVMAEHLGRCLSEDEIVHHIDGNKSNNDIGNLALTSRSAHTPLYASLVAEVKILRREVEVLKGKVTKQEHRITVLEWEKVLLSGRT